MVKSTLIRYKDYPFPTKPEEAKAQYRDVTEAFQVSSSALFSEIVKPCWVTLSRVSWARADVLFRNS